MMIKQNARSKITSLHGYKNCRVVEIGVGSFAECAKWGPVHCAHALPVGYRFLCMHPRVDDIIENTKKALLKAKRSPEDAAFDGEEIIKN